MEGTLYRLFIKACFLTLIWTSSLYGQRFSVGPALGLVASQVDGDGFQGYDKLGLRIGLRAEAHLNPNIDLVIELLYEQKGSRFESTELDYLDQGKNRILVFDYAEIPLLIRFYHRKHYRIFFETGFSFGRLIKHDFISVGRSQGFSEFRHVPDQLNKQEVNVVLGGGWQVSDHLGVLFRTTVAIRNFYDHNANPAESSTISDPDAQIVDHLRNYLISLGIFYRI